MTNGWSLALALPMLLPGAASAQEAARMPPALAALTGCWRGEGDVKGKAVTLVLAARPVAAGAMLAVDTESVAAADQADRYAAHLLFGGDGKGGLTGFWADSFGGAYTSTGQGAPTPDGFEITYPYPDAAFVNRWQLHDDRLAWQITARDPAGKDKIFARYTLHREACETAHE
ncbi:hypothetical protein ACX40Y_02785 [Sphingomonas sp. RS6]